MSEAFLEALDHLNAVAMSLSDMDEEEQRMVAMLVSDFAATLNDPEPPEWRIARMPVTWQ